jgi:hypothetical protein
MIAPSLIAGFIISIPVCHLVKRYAPNRAERNIQKQIEQSLREGELFEQRICTSKDGLTEAQQQLARFRSWREGVGR